MVAVTSSATFQGTDYRGTKFMHGMVTTHPGKEQVMEVRIDQGDVREIAAAVSEMLKPQLELLRGGREDDAIMGVTELAEYLGMSDKWIYDQTGAKRIPFFKLGNILKFRKKEIDKWVRSFDTPAVDKPTALRKLIGGRG